VVASDNRDGKNCGTDRSLGDAVVEAYKTGALPHTDTGGGGPGGGPAKRGTTAERMALGGTLVAVDNNGHPFYDTDLGILFTWYEGAWVSDVHTPETTTKNQVEIWVGDQAEILAQTYKRNDLWVDTEKTSMPVLRICKAMVITNTIGDWIAVGVQNNS